jgi:uncharacterized protein (DUF302 family)
MASYGMSTTVSGPREAVRERVVAALKDEGFGILTTIDVQRTLQEKIGVEIEPYEILGACNPSLAHRALEADRSIGLLLPCNVVLREVREGVEVSIQDPEVMFSVADAGVRERLSDFASDARQRLARVIAAVQRG